MGSLLGTLLCLSGLSIGLWSVLCESVPFIGGLGADIRLIDFNYFFSGYLSDAYWSSWLVVTHDLTVCLDTITLVVPY
jgi:hypothetical protein